MCVVLCVSSANACEVVEGGLHDVSEFVGQRAGGFVASDAGRSFVDVYEHLDGGMYRLFFPPVDVETTNVVEHKRTSKGVVSPCGRFDGVGCLASW